LTPQRNFYPARSFGFHCQKRVAVAQKSAPMRNQILLFLFAMAIFSGGSRNARADEALAKLDGDTIGKFHFVGIDRIAADPKATKLKELGALPETAVLRDNLMAKAASAPFRLLEHKLYGQNKNSYTNLLESLLNDLLHNESYTEVRGPTNAVPELLLAVQLNNARAAAWETNLATILAAWTGISVQPIRGEGFTGWELKKHHDPNVIRYLRAGDWALFGWGWEDLRLQPRFLQLIKQKRLTANFPKDDWMDAVLDFPAYQASHTMDLPSLLPAKLPKMHLAVEGRKDYIRPTLVMSYPAPLGITLEPWKIPTNAIPNTIVSFTAARGLASWLGQVPEMKPLRANPVPNQFTTWAVDKVPFETHLSIPVPMASNYLAHIAPGLMAELNASLSKRAVPGEAVWTNNEVMIRQIPFLAPYLRAIHDPTGDYLFGGLFPSRLQPGAKPVPPELMREIASKPKLLYYDWEINQARADQWQNIMQVYLIASTLPMPRGDLSAQKWIRAAGKLMGNCGTEISLTAPNELTLVRNSPIGLTGFEMNVLEYWLDSPEFPLHAIYPHISSRPGMFPPAAH
jgi:hypothetical protein